MAGSRELFWRRRAVREALRFNLGWWLHLYLPCLVGLGLLCGVAILALRSARLDFGWILPGAVLVGLVAALAAFFGARARFLSKSESLTRLDADLRLHTRLTSAADGIGDWPEHQPKARLALCWNWIRLCWPPAAAVLLVLAATVIPLPEATAKTTEARVEPPAWTATQEKVDALREDEIAQREAVDEIQETLDALRKQPADQWFRHESLEAGDHLQNQMTQNMADLQKNLETALAALDAARQIEESQMRALAEPLDKALNDALQSMELGQLPLSEEMLAKLKTLDAAKIRQLSAEEWKELSRRMKEGIGTCSGGTQPGSGQGDQPGNALLAIILGQGGVNRGPGTAPITLNEKETRLGTTDVEAVTNDDLTRAALGDLMGLGVGEHQNDANTWTGPAAGGEMSATGSGGDAVWQQTATPDEQGALKKFFQ